MGQITKAIIPAGGWGTRFLPATKAQPKEMLPVVDKPAIQYTIEEAVAAGIEDIIIITGRNKSSVEDHFDRNIELEMFLRQKGDDLRLTEVESIAGLADIHYIRQKEPLGLGHAVYCARKFIGNEPFAVLLGDDLIDNPVPVLKQMVERYDRVGGGAMVAVQEVLPDDVGRYGIVKPLDGSGEDLFQLSDLIEKPSPHLAPSRLAVVGRYILPPDILELLAGVTPGAGGEIQLTDALRRLVNGKGVWAYRFHGCRYDVGDKLGFLQATVSLALKREDLGKDFGLFLAELVEKMRLGDFFKEEVS